MKSFNKKGVEGWGFIQILSIALVLLVIGVAILVITGLSDKVIINSCCFMGEMMNRLTLGLSDIKLCGEGIMSNCP